MAANNILGAALNAPLCVMEATPPAQRHPAETSVARESINRKGNITLTPEKGFWTITFSNDKLVFRDTLNTRLPLRAELQRVGVFVDYDEGLVSFYDVEARVHMYSASGCTFSEPLYPILCPCLHNSGKNSAPLIISPFMGTGTVTRVLYGRAELPWVGLEFPWVGLSSSGWDLISPGWDLSSPGWD
ncbi:Pyrin [Merluccius polli]|uniref:Pyrin n=1 Tax=Merluccius polli TaxID=89951 RepID=A0AA47MPQ4_MERPO|nr:Pyrin [Merluccius polli]